MTTIQHDRRTHPHGHRGLLAALVVAILLGAAGPARAQARLDVSLTVFHDGLSHSGNWVASARFGEVWYPHHAHLWRPYRDGYWAYTDVGWTWVSDEPWAWATYHYGRWVFDDEYGWVWVPDTVWGPAWVAWRYNDDYVGWAPLPPGVAVRDDFDPVIDASAFVFVRTRYLCDRHLVNYVDPEARNVTYVGLTSNATRFSVSGGVYVNRGVDVNFVSRAIGRPVPRLTVQATTVEGPARVTSGHVEVYRPASVAVARPTERVPNVRANEAPSRVAAPERVVAPERQTSPERAVAPDRRAAPERVVAPERRAAPERVVAPEQRAAPAHAAAPVERPADMAARHQQESRNLAADQAHQRAALEKEHAVETAHPPAGMTRAQVATRQQTEHQAQAQNDARQKQALDARHAQESHPQPPRPPQPQNKPPDKGKGRDGRGGGGGLAPQA